ncbi:2-haloacid dehalogenase [Anaeroplasma bactoclasticum]|jgi:2-haloacid dehalogenase|uniref:2-haloacid dehalogenase n=1 Tax=Anaeroplasma bactoclasticum TaxID=2088 RepID=A0A397S256_9MOLU|nr:YjjG family noncanonical pyrimidine nucleotidase [Anaeroplasma bactoclasticum]RIA78475.1 2-haloacid dehalogenase [Anaeroplasma bactoclasticum]
MKCILFDIDGTLMDFNQAERNAFIKTIKNFTDIIPNDEDIKMFSDINERLFNEFAKGNLTRIEFQKKRFREIMNHMQIDGDEEIFNLCYRSAIEKEATLYDGVIEVLDYLKGKYRLFIASNGMSKVQLQRLAIANIKEYFEDYFISDDIGYAKPDKNFFLRVMERVGNNNPKDYIMIGDRMDADIIGAKEVGMDGILFTKDALDCTTIKTIKELKNIL